MTVRKSGTGWWVWRSDRIGTPVASALPDRHAAHAALRRAAALWTGASPDATAPDPANGPVCQRCQANPRRCAASLAETDAALTDPSLRQALAAAVRYLVAPR